MLGYTRNQILGQSIHEFTHHTRADGSPYAAEECPIYDAFRKGTPIRGQLSRRDGDRRSTDTRYFQYAYSALRETVR